MNGRQAVEGNVERPAAQRKQDASTTEDSEVKCLRCRSGRVKRMRRRDMNNQMIEAEKSGYTLFWKCRACGTVQNRLGLS